MRRKPVSQVFGTQAHLSVTVKAHRHSSELFKCMHTVATWQSLKVSVELSFPMRQNRHLAAQNQNGLFAFCPPTASYFEQVWKSSDAFQPLLRLVTFVLLNSQNFIIIIMTKKNPFKNIQYCLEASFGPHILSSHLTLTRRCSKKE